MTTEPITIDESLAEKWARESQEKAEERAERPRPGKPRLIPADAAETHYEASLGREFGMWTVRRGTPVWITLDHLPVINPDAFIALFQCGHGDDFMYYIDDDVLVISDSMQWHDDGVRIRCLGWQPLAPTFQEDRGYAIVPFVRPGVLA